MIFGLEFPPISHVVEWPTLFGDGPFAVPGPELTKTAGPFTVPVRSAHSELVGG